MNAQRLHASPGVAHVAWRYASESTLGVFYDVALMVGEEGRQPWWDCSCPGATFRDSCKHTRNAARRLAALASVVRANMKRSKA